MPKSRNRPSELDLLISDMNSQTIKRHRLSKPIMFKTRGEAHALIGLSICFIIGALASLTLFWFKGMPDVAFLAIAVFLGVLALLLMTTGIRILRRLRTLKH